jgi:hypothetical protein
MHKVYAYEKVLDVQKYPPIFLVGPTPREKSVESWRPEACQYLEAANFNGQVLIPEPRDGVWSDYINQAEWEWVGLDFASLFGCIAAWVPRNLENMPAFTTNVEFGMYVDCPRFKYGRPDDAPKNRYLDLVYKKKRHIFPQNSLEDLMYISCITAFS